MSKLLSRFDTIEAKVTAVDARLVSIEAHVAALDSRLDSIQVDQIRVKTELERAKDLIVSQQKQLEAIERENRRCNVILSGIPESDVRYLDTNLSEDIDKVEVLCITLCRSFHPQSIASCYRLGKDKGRAPRLLKVRFECHQTKSEVLRSQCTLRQNEDFRAAFGTVYVNNDSTTLVRKEERRLRIKLKEMKSVDDIDRLYIRGGMLYKNDTIVDTVNVANQLF